MIVGTPSHFAIESGITRGYERLSFRALGFFVVYIGGERYGVYAPDASMLACSLDRVENCLDQRGSHLAPFANEIDGGKIADAYLGAIYSTDQENGNFLGFSQAKFSELLYAKRLIWTHGGDEEFDDGSHVLQFDVGDRVRLIAFRRGVGWRYDPKTFREIWLPTDDFYRILQQWRDGFVAEWLAMPKISEREDQAEFT